MIKFEKTLNKNSVLTFSHSGELVAGTKNGITLYNTRDFSCFMRFDHQSDIGHILFSQNDEILATKDFQGLIRMYSINSQTHIHTFHSIDKRDGSNFVFSPDDEYIIDGDWGGNIRLLNLKTFEKKILQTLPNCMINSVSLDLKNGEVIFTIFYKGGLSIYDPQYYYLSYFNYIDGTLVWVKDGNKIPEFLLGPIVEQSLRRIVFFNQGSSKKYEIQIYDLDFTKLIVSIPLGDVRCAKKNISISSGGKYLIVNYMDSIRIYDTKEYELVVLLNIDGLIRFSYDDRIVSVCSSDGKCFISSLNHLV